MPLPGASADAVAVAQAFHWFDGDAALAEIHRVLRPGGALALVWNRRRTDDPQNLDRIEELLDLALDLGAQRLELANTQYYGWAVANQDALMPSWEQLRRAEEAVQRFRERVGPRVDVLWVLPDFYEDLPKPCMGGWGRMHRTMKRPLRV